MRRALFAGLCVLLCATIVSAAEGDTSVRLKDLGHVDGWRDNALVGYGLVTGLAGSGDSQRNQATRQSISNLLSQYGVAIAPEQVQSRNAAVVMVTATLPPFADSGTRLDVNISSMGDAHSLLGGALLLTPLKGPDGRIHALAQGPISVGGYKYDLYGNVVQKNHPTVGMIPAGASVELGVPTRDITPDGRAHFVLTEADYTTAGRVAEAINAALGESLARAESAAMVEIRKPASEDAVSFFRRIENVALTPDGHARVVINERSGIVVSGGDVRISKTSIAFGDLKVSIASDLAVYRADATLLPRRGAGLENRAPTLLAPQTHIDVDEEQAHAVSMPGNNSVADLIQALGRVKTSPRDMIAILQSMRAAGALHAELIIQ